MLKLLKIKGYSMSPSYLEGDYVVSISPKLAKLKIGDIIVFNHPKYGLMIKEIIEKKSEGYLVRGTSPASTDSESIGLVTEKMIQGKVVRRIKSKPKKTI